ncbi:MAG: serine/threonine protein kinase [Gammaproteobacteria bacterium]|nr:serine/threonine protein kinase [Gammaproteobacteria bacterium]
MALSDYTLTTQLSSHSHHEVWRASHDVRGGEYTIRLVPRPDNMQERQAFLDRLQQLQSIRHLGLCEISEVGEADSRIYIVSPYYYGGDLAAALARGLSIADVRHIISELCDALHVLHMHGFVHGDVKPANVVFEVTGRVVLIDGAYLDSPTATRSFSPGYSAPELARGGSLQPACDVFSLGAMIVRVLHGELPWRASTDQSIRTRGASDSLPPLGPQYAMFSSFLESTTAFDPAARLSSMLQVKSALNTIGASGELTTVAVKSDLIETQEIRDVLPPLQMGESALGRNVEHFDRRSVVSWTAVAVIALAGVVAVFNGLYHISTVQRLLADAGIFDNPALVEARLNAQGLSVDPMQNLQSIVAAYQVVLTFDPKDESAIEGIAAARTKWEREFEMSLQLNDLAVAQNRLNELRAIYPDDIKTLSMFDELQVRRHALRLTSDTVALLNVSGPDDSASAEMALHAFREVLRLYPASAAAMGALDDLASHFTDLAANEVENENIQAAMNALNNARLANPAYQDLAVVREKIQRATTVRDEIEARLAEARILRQTNKLIDPPDRNAAVLYHSVLTTDPDNTEALNGLGELSALVVNQFHSHLEAREFSAVRNLIDRAKTVGLYPASLMHMETALDAELANISEAASLVVQAQQQLTDGFITEPADRNAVTLLLNARKLDATNSHINELLAQCVNRLAAVAADANTYGLDDVAATYASLAAQLEADAGI